MTRQPDFGATGLVTAVVQDSATNRVLMLAHMNEEAWSLTVRTHRAWFWSRSRNQLWEKGATSGNTMTVVGISLDCDSDAVLLRVLPAGPACHTGAASCFFTEVALERPAGPDRATTAPGAVPDAVVDAPRGTDAPREAQRGGGGGAEGPPHEVAPGGASGA